MVFDPHRPQNQSRNEPQLGRNQPGPDFSAHNPSGPRGFSIDPGDRPYQQAGMPEPEAKSSGWFGRIVMGGFVAILCAGGIWYGANKARSHLNPGEAPLIQADPSPVKVKPDNPSGVSSDETPPTYDRQAANRAQVEQLLPPPEAPMARPQAVPEPPPTPHAAAAQTAQAPSADRFVEQPPPSQPPARDIAAVPVPKSVPSAGSPTPLTRPLPLTMPADDSATASGEPAATPAQQAAGPPKPKSASGMTGPVRVQIAATMSPAAAQQEWHRLQHAHIDLLGGLQPTVVKVEILGKGTFYRVQAGPVDNKAAADKLCTALKKVSIGCIVIHP